MALTINRRKEISEKEFSAIKKRFKQKTTTTGAIYASIKYAVYTAPGLEEKLKISDAAIKEITGKYNKLIETIKKKHVLDNEFEAIVLSQEK